MGLFSSSKSSSSTSSTTVNTSIDKRIAADNGAIALSGDSVSLNLTDAGAVKAALDFARSNDQNVYTSVQQLLGATDDAFNKTGERLAGAYSSNLAALGKAYDDAKGEGTQKNYVAAAAIAAVAVVALIAVWGRFK